MKCKNKYNEIIIKAYHVIVTGPGGSILQCSINDLPNSNDRKGSLYSCGLLFTSILSSVEEIKE